VEPLAKEGGLFLNTCAGVSPELLVTPLLMGPVCLLSQGRFEELQSAPAKVRREDNDF